MYNRHPNIRRAFSTTGRLEGSGEGALRVVCFTAAQQLEVGSRILQMVVLALLALLATVEAFSPGGGAALRRHDTAAAALSSRRAAAVHAQQGPLEEGFKELLPLATKDENVDPELVARIEREVFELTGSRLEDLLNPSKVVNYERERIILSNQIEASTDAAGREELQARLTKIEKQLYSEKRTVFSAWLKAVFIGQAVIAAGVSGVAAFDAFPTVTIDISLQALGFWRCGSRNTGMDAEHC
jgi:hypothetical protein